MIWVALAIFGITFWRAVPRTAEGIDLLSPPVVFGVAVLLGYLAPMANFLDGTDFFTLRYGLDIGDIHRRAIQSASLALFAGSAFFVGYRAAARRSTNSQFSEVRPAPAWSRARMGSVVVSYSVIGAVLFAYGVHRVGGSQVVAAALGDRIRLTEGLNYLFSAINLLPSCAIAWAALIGVSPRSGDSRWYWPFFALSAAAAAVQGSKSILFVLIVSLVIIRHRTSRRFTATQLTVGAALLFVLLTAYAIFAREFLAVGEVVTLDSWDIDSMWFVTSREFVANFIQLQMLALLLDKVPGQLAYQYGATMLSLLTLPIPRGLWAGKPITAPGVVTLAFWPEVYLNDGTSLPPGLFGELFMNFGIFGVVIGVFLLGAGSGLLTAAQRQAPNDPLILTAYALLTAMLPHYVRGEFVSPTALYLILAIPAMAVVLYVRLGSNRGITTYASAEVR